MNFLDLSRLGEIWTTILPLGQAIVIFSILFFVVNVFIKILQSRIIKRVKTKKQAAATMLFIRALRYILIGLLVVLALSIASDSLQQFGFTVSILSAAVGFALQKPITGLAAWLMLIIKRPFQIGDRVTIGSVRGNVKEITLTHVYLEEVGRYGGEEVSGRTIIIANSKLFEENIVNYTSYNEYILGQIILTVTFESDVEKAIAIILKIVREETDQYSTRVGKAAHVRLYFTSNGMEIHPRYYVPVNIAQEIASKITRNIFLEFKYHKDIELAYQQYRFSDIPKQGKRTK